MENKISPSPIAVKQDCGKKKATLLIADDDPMIPKMLIRGFMGSNYEFRTASNGQEALELYKKCRADLVISDYDMPLVNGLTLLEELRLFDPKASVLIYSGGRNEDDRRMLLQEGALGIIDKGCGFEEIKSAVENALRSAELESFKPAPERIAGEAEKNARILFVDDDAETLLASSNAAAMSGYSVKTASKAVEALQIYAREGADVVVSNLHMPLVSGLELLRALKAIDPNAKVIMASGMASHEEVDAAMKVGAGVFLRKPYEIEDLDNAIKKMLGG